MNYLSDQEKEELGKLGKKATPGPWMVKEIPEMEQFFVAAATTEDHPYHEGIHQRITGCS